MANAPVLSECHNDVLEAYTSLNEYTYSEIESYMRVTGHRLDAWEVKAIMQLAKYRNQEPKWQPNTQR